MPYWLVNLIVVVCLVVIFIAILGAMAMLFTYRLNVERNKVDALVKENNHKQELLNAYGIKEIYIGGDDN